MHRLATLLTVGATALSGAALATARPAAAQEGAQTAVATLLDTEGKELGRAQLVEGPHGVVLRIELVGLEPGFKGLHFHGVGTCEDHHAGFKASGSHVNPAEVEHGFLNPKGPDAGDLPNLGVAADGSAQAEVFSTLVSLTGAGDRPALLDADGSALLIHAKTDDHLSQPIGGAGDRIACGVIEKGE